MLRFFWFVVLFLSLGALPQFVSAINADIGSEGLSSSEDRICTRIEFYSREGCPHCAAATKFFVKLQQTEADIVVHKIDINESKDALKQFIAANQRFNIKRPGVPLIVVCDHYYIGYDTDETSGKEILALMSSSVLNEDITEHSNNTSPKEDSLDMDSAKSKQSAESVNLPLLGEVSVSDIGLPLFTIAIGLIDGFNPCAMWVLLFILSLVVNVKDRTRVILIAGTFVVISGLVYFAFMAAWLNIFKVVGWSRHLQVVIALVALFVAAVHIKDFFAFKKGFSLSIPEKFKPAIYRQSLKVIRQNNLLLSMSAVAVLAVMVNFIELLCTAGLPALYTQILVQQGLTEAAYYGYLALYNLAYIFDDGLMVGIAVVTLRHNKLQEQQGKWLKLLSGLTVLVLGLLLLFAPSWLF